MHPCPTFHGIVKVRKFERRIFYAKRQALSYPFEVIDIINLYKNQEDIRNKGCLEDGMALPPQLWHWWYRG